MTRIGYARCSTRIQNDDSQIADLLAAGVAAEDIYVDKVSGKLASRPGWDQALARLGDGDTLVITRLSRAMRSLRDLIDLVPLLQERHANLQVLKQAIDTTTPTGRLVFHILGAIDEFQRELIIENTMEGLEAAKAKGHFGGRPPALTPVQVVQAKTLIDSGVSVAEVARSFKVSRASVYRAFDRQKVSS